MNKKVFKIIGLGLIVGLLVLLVQIVFKLNNEVVMSYYIKISVIVLFLVLVVNSLYFIYMTRKMKNYLTLFYEEKYDEYIDVMEKFLQKARGNALKNIIKINLSAGYIELKDYEKGKELLETLEIHKIKDEQLRLVQWNNLCVAYFHLGEYDKFKEIYSKQENLFERNKDNVNFAKAIAELKVLYLIIEGDFIKAKDLLSEIREKWDNEKYKAEYDKIENIINENLKEK
ncbi:MAG: hypothetical protein Q4E02_02170 [Lagierella massiliensis]|nr:hypothetical protein [Lagierella massiliensis]